jgi:hypothetical protein
MVSLGCLDNIPAPKPSRYHTSGYRYCHTARPTDPTDALAGTPNPTIARTRRCVATTTHHTPHITVSASVRTTRLVAMAQLCAHTSDRTGPRQAHSRCRLRRLGAPTRSLGIALSPRSVAVVGFSASTARRCTCPPPLLSGCADRTPVGPPRGTQRSAPAPTAGRSANRRRTDGID